MPVRPQLVEVGIDSFSQLIGVHSSVITAEMLGKQRDRERRVAGAQQSPRVVFLNAPQE